MLSSSSDRPSVSNSSTGNCSVCHAAVHLIKSKGTIRKHGHGRGQAVCPGSHLAPVCLTLASSVDTFCPEQSGDRALVHVNHPGKILRRIPRGARSQAADRLTSTIQRILDEPLTPKPWQDLMDFASACFSQPTRGGKRRNLTKVILQQINATSAATSTDISGLTQRCADGRKRAESDDKSAARRASLKLEEGDVKGAIRTLCSDETMREPDEESWNILISKHPQAPSDRRTTTRDDITAAAPVQVTLAEKREAIQSFPQGSAGGRDGLRPQHLKDMAAGDTGMAFLASMTEFVNFLLMGNSPTFIRPLLFGANLLALNKKGGGLRPIAVGSVIRRLSAKVASRKVTSKCAAILGPRQLGFGIPRGSEIAVNAVRLFLQNIRPEDICIKLDISNAFNCLRRDSMLDAVAKYVPELYAFTESAYISSSVLAFGQYTVSSDEGTQQGDPLAPLLFCLTINDLLASVDADLAVGFLDDLTVGGEEEMVTSEILRLQDEFMTLGLSLNPTKCEIIATNPEVIHRAALAGIDYVETRVQEVVILGAPIFEGHVLDATIVNFTTKLDRMGTRLGLMAAHDALFLVKSSLAIPRLVYTLRSSPSFCSTELLNFDNCVRSTLSKIVNINLTDDIWEQASLPLRWGGLGVRSAVFLAPSAYLATAASAAEAVSILLPDRIVNMADPYVVAALRAWKILIGSEDRDNQGLTTQKALDNEACKTSYGRIIDGTVSVVSKARLRAASSKSSGDWLKALPIASLGLKLDDRAVSVAVGLRLGAHIVAAHVCVCGAPVGIDGLHGLSCRRSTGRLIRHQMLNDIIYRGLKAAGVPSSKEPIGLDRGDGKRPDGISLIPWKGGRCLAWDVTCADTFAASHVASSATTPRYAATRSEDLKRRKYQSLAQRFTFEPIAVETSGAIGETSQDFISMLGAKIGAVSGDIRETAYLRQRISIAIQRGNAISILNTFDAGDIHNEDE